MAEEERAVAHPVVDVLVAVDVPLVAALRARHVGPERQQVADVVGDAAGNGLARALGQGGRSRMLGPVLLQDGHRRLAFLDPRDRRGDAGVFGAVPAIDTGFGGDAEEPDERDVDVEAEAVHRGLRPAREAVDGAGLHAGLDQPALRLRSVQQRAPGEPAQRGDDAVRAPVRHAGHHEMIGADHGGDARHERPQPATDAPARCPCRSRCRRRPPRWSPGESRPAHAAMPDGPRPRVLAHRGAPASSRAPTRRCKETARRWGGSTPSPRRRARSDSRPRGSGPAARWRPCGSDARGEGGPAPHRHPRDTPRCRPVRPPPPAPLPEAARSAGSVT